MKGGLDNGKESRYWSRLIFTLCSNIFYHSYSFFTFGRYACNKYWCNTIKRQPKVGEWIPVSESLPNANVNVLVTYKDDDDNFVVDTDCRNKTINNWLYFGNDVIAWQPLPEPYREESVK